MGHTQLPVEIKSGQTISEDSFKGIQFWNKLTDTTGGYLIYGGDTTHKRSNGITVMPFNSVAGINFDNEI